MGLSGRRGRPGYDGRPGLRGIIGRPGTPGIRGPEGAEGPRGTNGAPGTPGLNAPPAPVEYYYNGQCVLPSPPPQLCLLYLLCRPEFLRAIAGTTLPCPQLMVCPSLRKAAAATARFWSLFVACFAAPPSAAAHQFCGDLCRVTCSSPESQ